jgi:hypothetical protein
MIDLNVRTAAAAWTEQAEERKRQRARTASGSKAKPLWEEDGKKRSLLDKYVSECLCVCVCLCLCVCVCALAHVCEALQLPQVTTVYGVFLLLLQSPCLCLPCWLIHCHALRHALVRYPTYILVITAPLLKTVYLQNFDHRST